MNEPFSPLPGSDLVPLFSASTARSSTADTTHSTAHPGHASTTPAFLPPTTSPRWRHLHGLDVRALYRLPGNEDDDPYARLVAAWLLTLTSTHTTRAYAGEAAVFARWCTEHALHPFEVERWHLDAYRRALTTTPTRTGRPRAAATISRALSALAGLYSHGVSLGVLTHSPVADVRRPRVAPESQSIALSAPELRALMRAAEQHSPRAAALTSLLMLTGIRIGEALAADVTDLGADAGHRVLRITRKGGKRARVVLPAASVRALETYLSGRTHGPLFCNTPSRPPASAEGAGGAPDQVHDPETGAGTGPSAGAASQTAAQASLAAAGDAPVGASLARWQYGPASRLLTQLFALAGVSDQATAHSLRHSWVTESLDLGVPLQDVQDAAGHADPRTTRRYHRSRDHLDRSPNDRLAAALLD